MSNVGIRKFPRISTDLVATVITKGANREAHPTTITELGQGGAFLKSDTLLGTGRAIILEGRYPWGEFEVPCRILYQNHEDGRHGMGVRFEAGEEGPPSILVDYINKNLSQTLRAMMEVGE